MTPPTTTGTASDPGLPVRKVHAELQACDVARIDLTQGGVPHRARIVPEGRPIVLGESAAGEQKQCRVSSHPTTLIENHVLQSPLR